MMYLENKNPKLCNCFIIVIHIFITHPAAKIEDLKPKQCTCLLTQPCHYELTLILDGGGG